MSDGPSTSTPMGAMGDANRWANSRDSTGENLSETELSIHVSETSFFDLSLPEYDDHSDESSVGSETKSPEKE